MHNRGIRIDRERCTGCGLCIKACPFQAISMVAGKALIDYNLCTLCGACSSSCEKYQAIVFQEDTDNQSQTGRGPVWVFGECEATGELSRVARELLNGARDLAAALQVPLEAVLIGHGLEAAAGQCIADGADKALLVEHPSLKHYLDQPFAAILARLIRQREPEIVLGGATAVGRALLPRTAVLAETGLTADCTELAIDSETGLLRQTRPAFGGNILAAIFCPEHRPQMATVRPGVMSAPQEKRSGRGNIERLSPRKNELDSGLRHLRLRQKGTADRGLREAEVIVTAGAGVGGPEGVAQVEVLARKLSGCLGATRSVVDAGWADYSRQIGQTGTTVQPRLYIACGVSGAIQHLVGMQNSDRIIAVNKDPEAPIFKYADLAIVGDVKQILEQTLEQMQEL